MSLIFLFNLFSIFEFSETGGLSSFLLARGGVADIGVVASFNPSLMGEMENGGISLTFTQPYNLKELKYLRGDAFLKRLKLGLSLSSLRHPGYGEWTFSLSKGFISSGRFSSGVLFSLYSLSILNYEKDFFFALSPSFTYALPPFLISLCLFNLNQPKSEFGEKMPLTFNLGLSSLLKRTSSSFCLFFDYERGKEETMRLGFLFSGFRQAFTSQKGFSFGFGISTEPVLFAFGFSLPLAKVSLGYSLRWHYRLKEYHIINFSWSFPY